MKIFCVVLGILTEVAVTWYNTYGGDTELWASKHFLRIAVVAAILGFFIEIIRSANKIKIATYFTLGVVLVVVAVLFYELFLQRSSNFYEFPYVFLHVVVAFAATLIGAFLGWLVLKDKYK